MGRVSYRWGWGALMGLGACGTSAEGPTQQAVVDHYAGLVAENYQDTLAGAEALDQSIKAFVAAPSAAGLEAARGAWRAARVPYGQSEAFRFYDGPIDDPTSGPEGRINPWPLDEAYIDQVEGSTGSASIISNPSFTLDAETLRGLHEGGRGDVFGAGQAFDREKAVALGYHAIEFLLWGQDRSASGPGDRPYTDFLETGGTRAHGARRGQYLLVVSRLLVEDLKSVAAEWAPGVDNYRARFTADPPGALKKLMSALGILAKGELGSERMDVALTTQDQEDEQSCFSDNTDVDFRMNQQGIENVYLGRYGAMEGPGVRDLLRAADPIAEEAMTAHVLDLSARLAAFEGPVDQAIAQPSSRGYQQLSTIVGLLFEEGDQVARAAATIGLGTISVELPE